MIGVIIKMTVITLLLTKITAVKQVIQGIQQLSLNNANFMSNRTHLDATSCSKLPMVQEVNTNWEEVRHIVCSRCNVPAMPIWLL